MKKRSLSELLKPNGRLLANAILTKLPPSSIPDPGGPKVAVDANEAPSDFQTNQFQLMTARPVCIAVQRDERAGIKITNLSYIDVYILSDPSKFQGNLTTVGDLLPGIRGSWMWVPCKAAIWAIAASGTPTISILEVYGVLES